MATIPGPQRSGDLRGLLRGSRGFYSGPGDRPRVRRATDVVGLVAALLALVGVVAAQPPGSLERSFLRFLRAFPSWLDPVWACLIGLLGVWVVVVLVVPLASRRPRIAAEAVLAVVLAGLAGLLAARIATGDWPGAQEVAGLSTRLRFPGIRLAIAAAVISVVNANLTRPFAAAGRRILALGAAGALMDGLTTVGGTVAAVLVGIAAGAAVRVALGTSAGLPTIRDVGAALDDLGVRATDLEAAGHQTAGVFLVHGREPEGRGLTIKVYGRDAYDNQMLEKLWRAIWYRDGGSSVSGLNRSQGAEREALLTLLARNAGAPTAAVVTAGATARGDSLVVLRVSGTPLESLAPGDVDDAVLREGWSTIARLGEANVAHGRINPASVRVDKSAGEVSFVDLGGGTVAPDQDDRLTDRAQFLATTATEAGTDRAVAAAIAESGSHEVAALLPYLQSAAFGQPLRRALKEAAIDVDELRAVAAAAAGVDAPELAKLRRITWGTLLQIVLLVLAGAAVLSFVGGVDVDQFKQALREASWGWIAAGLVVAQLPRVTQAVATRASVPAQLPLGPVYVLQLATSYMNRRCRRASRRWRSACASSSARASRRRPRSRPARSTHSRTTSCRASCLSHSSCSRARR